MFHSLLPKEIELNRKTSLAVVGLASIALLGAGCAPTAATAPSSQAGASDYFADMDPIELTFNHTNPPGGHFEAATVAFIDYIEGKTEGKVTVQPFYSGSLLPAAEVFSGVGSGLADISYTTTIGFEDYFPIGDWLTTAMSPDTRPFPWGRPGKLCRRQRLHHPFARGAG